MCEDTNMSCALGEVKVTRSDLGPGPWNGSLHGRSVVFKLGHGLRSRLSLTDISAAWGL